MTNATRQSIMYNNCYTHATAADVAAPMEVEELGCIAGATRCAENYTRDTETL